MSTRGGTTWSPGLLVAVALTYATVALVCFGVGYLIGRLLL
jgi:hypothetical protein